MIDSDLPVIFLPALLSWGLGILRLEICLLVYNLDILASMRMGTPAVALPWMFTIRCAIGCGPPPRLGRPARWGGDTVL